MRYVLLRLLFPLISNWFLFLLLQKRDAADAEMAKRALESEVARLQTTATSLSAASCEHDRAHALVSGDFLPENRLDNDSFHAMKARLAHCHLSFQERDNLRQQLTEAAERIAALEVDKVDSRLVAPLYRAYSAVPSRSALQPYSYHLHFQLLPYPHICYPRSDSNCNTLKLHALRASTMLPLRLDKSSSSVLRPLFFIIFSITALLNTSPDTFGTVVSYRRV